MNKGDRCILITDNTLAANKPLVDQWNSDRSNQGWNPYPSVSGEGSSSDLRKYVLSLKGPNLHVFLAGDGVPFININMNPSGHGDGPTISDYKFVTDDSLNSIGAIGRVWFKAQSGAGVPSFTLYQRYFDNRHGWATRKRPPRLVSVCDHLHYGDYLPMGDRVRAGVPPELLEALYPAPSDNDGVMEAWGREGRMYGVALSGGQPFINPGGEYYFGGAQRWRDNNPDVPFFAAYFSNATELEWDNSLLTATLTCRTLVAFWTYQGYLPFWKMLDRKTTAGECGLAAAQVFPWANNVYGDCTMSDTQIVAATGAVVSQADFDAYRATSDARMGTVEARLARLESAPPPQPTIKVESATYFRDDGKGQVDVTDELQALLNAGPCWVYDATRPHLIDFAEGYPKHLQATLTKGGVTKSLTFTQYEQIRWK